MAQMSVGVNSMVVAIQNHMETLAGFFNKPP